jgi:hypothetical protein
MDNIARMAPQCEADIANYREKIAELEQRDFDSCLAETPAYLTPESRQLRAGYEYQKALERLDACKRAIADAELVLQAARRWNSPLVPHQAELHEERAPLAARKRPSLSTPSLPRVSGPRHGRLF